jgi:hypothetical protein
MKNLLNSPFAILRFTFLLLAQMVFFNRYMHSLYLPEQAYLEQTEAISTLKSMIARKSSFQKLTQFSQANNVLDAEVSNINGFLGRGTWVSSSQQNRIHWRKHSSLHLEATRLQEIFLSKPNSMLSGKQCARYSSF